MKKRFLKRMSIYFTLIIVLSLVTGCSSLKTGEKNHDKVDDSSNSSKTNKTIVIDAGHQIEGISEHESIGPDATKTKPKLTSGTSGVVTGVPEYQLNLDVSLKLRDELKSRGYNVVMIREDNNCPLSNKERAEIANKYDGIFLRIHANSIGNNTTSGILTMSPADDNPYCTQEVISNSKKLSSSVLGEMISTTKANNMGIIYSNEMSGINWCKIPVTIVEMGFMSNPEEDKLMQTDEYQNKIVEGISNGVDLYFK